MRDTIRVAGIGLVLMTAGVAEATPGLVTILDCNFDDKTVDAPIGAGGAAVGEPVSLGEVPAIVRGAPLPTPCLELTEDWGFGARAVRFEFEDGVAISSGTLVVRFQLYFPAERNNFTIYVRESSFSAVPFLSLRFNVDGELYLEDLNDGGARFLANYATETPLDFEIRWDLDAQSYDFHLDGSPLLDGESLGPIPTGIGALLFGPDHDGDAAGTFFLDSLTVQATAVPDPVHRTSWGALKGMAPVR